MVAPGYSWANPAQSAELALRVAAVDGEGAVLAAGCAYVSSEAIGPCLLRPAAPSRPGSPSSTLRMGEAMGKPHGERP